MPPPLDGVVAAVPERGEVRIVAEAHFSAPMGDEPVEYVPVFPHEHGLATGEIDRLHAFEVADELLPYVRRMFADRDHGGAGHGATKRLNVAMPAAAQLGPASAALEIAQVRETEIHQCKVQRLYGSIRLGFLNKREVVAITAIDPMAVGFTAGIFDFVTARATRRRFSGKHVQTQFSLPFRVPDLREGGALGGAQGHIHGRHAAGKGFTVWPNMQVRPRSHTEYG